MKRGFPGVRLALAWKTAFRPPGLHGAGAKGQRLSGPMHCLRDASARLDVLMMAGDRRLDLDRVHAPTSSSP